MDLIPYNSIINPHDYEHLAIIMLILGFIISSYFFVYQITYSKKQRYLSREILSAVYASFFLSGGFLFFALSCGINI